MPDFENLQAVELISDRKIRIRNLETEKFIDLEITNELLNEEAKIIQISLKGNHIAVSFVKGSGKTIQRFIACYSLNPFELLFVDELSTVSDGKIRSVNVNFSGQNQEQPYFIGNCLLAWDMRSPFRVYNLLDGTSKVNKDWYHVCDINGTLYCISDGKIDIINPVTMQMKTVKFKSDRSFAGYLPFIDKGMFDNLDMGVLPQRNLDRYLVGQAFGWYSTVSRLNHPGELIKMESCPTFSIKRVAEGEFRIENTSPDCNTPLNANVYLVPWTKEGNPVYWKAKNPVANINNLTLEETISIKIEPEKTKNLGRFALVIESNGLLDTANSELSDFDKEGRPLFDGVPIGTQTQQSVVITLWKY